MTCDFNAKTNTLEALALYFTTATLLLSLLLSVPVPVSTSRRACPSGSATQALLYYCFTTSYLYPRADERVRVAQQLRYHRVISYDHPMYICNICICNNHICMYISISQTERNCVFVCVCVCVCVCVLQ
jgi:hypothetical protein